MIHSGLPFFNPLLSVGGVPFPWALPTYTTPPSSPPVSPNNGTKLSSFTIDAILGLRRQQEVQESQNNNIRSSLKWREERRSKVSPYTLPRQVQENNNSLKENLEHGHSSGSKGKSKRVRTIFTTEQLERMESEFQRQQYMVGPERLYLAATLDLTEAQVKVWFQNRRIKWRKAFVEQRQKNRIAQNSPNLEITQNTSTFRPFSTENSIQDEIATSYRKSAQKPYIDSTSQDHKNYDNQSPNNYENFETPNFDKFHKLQQDLLSKQEDYHNLVPLSHEKFSEKIQTAKIRVKSEEKLNFSPNSEDFGEKKLNNFGEVLVIHTDNADCR